MSRSFEQGWQDALDAWRAGNTWEDIVETFDSDNQADVGARACVCDMSGWRDIAESMCKTWEVSYEPLRRLVDELP